MHFRGMGCRAKVSEPVYSRHRGSHVRTRNAPLQFQSILFDKPDAATVLDTKTTRELFGDLNLDQVFNAVRAGRDEYKLERLFRAPLNDAESIRYRQDVLRDLESDALVKVVRSFGAGMRTMRLRLGRGEVLHHPYQKLRWLLEATVAYADAVSGLAHGLGATTLGSAGFAGLRDYVAAYRKSPAFMTMLADAAALTSALSEVRYNLHIKGGRIRVTRYAGEEDYGAEVERTFAKFAQGAVREHEFSFRQEPDMDHVEGAVLDMVAELHPEVFGLLDQFVEKHGDYLDPVIGTFDREIQFCLAYLEYIEPMRDAGLPFCYPVVQGSTKEVLVRDGYDLALGRKLRHEAETVVRNDLRLSGSERILVVTGPNQGGKTTLARMVGQLHYLCRLGLPVPGREARLYLFDRLFAHFERREVTGHLTGKLEDDLRRIHHIFDEATDRSLVILNESFSATTVDDGLLLGRQVLEELIERDMLAIYVTFLHELASAGRSTVSMVSAVDASDPGRRTFKFERRPAEGLAYALAIAEKHRLTYKDVKDRIAGAAA
jgi:DNA mismatch repair protein MutS